MAQNNFFLADIPVENKPASGNGEIVQYEHERPHRRNWDPFSTPLQYDNEYDRYEKVILLLAYRHYQRASPF